MWLVEWYGGLPPWVRFCVAGFFLLLSAIFLAFGRVLVWGWALGIAFLIFAFPTAGEKKGYHDF